MMSLMNEAKQNKNIPKNWKTIKSSILKSDQNMLVAASKQKSDIQQQNNSSAPLVNLVICPICKETLWGAQKYSDHLRTVHGDKNQNEGSPKLPLIRVKIPLYKQRKYKSWPHPEKSKYVYSSYQKYGQPLRSEAENCQVASVKQDSKLVSTTPMQPNKNENKVQIRFVQAAIKF